MTDLVIRPQWESALHESIEVRQTSAMLRIELGADVITRNQDEWSRTIRDEVRLSAYPLALWLASSWWRLRYEPLPLSAPTRTWRMAHELSAAGYGYVWPRMLFAADGEDMQVWATQSVPESKASVRYLTNSHQTLSVASFERVVDEFIDGVISRLHAVGVTHTELHDVWAEVVQERADTSVAALRRLEAMLGFDPDGCADQVLARLDRLVPEVGASATAEIASICTSLDPGADLDRVVAFSQGSGITGQMNLPLSTASITMDRAVPVWQRGRDLARQVRSAVSLNGSAASDELICELVGLPPDQAFVFDLPARAPLGVAIRNGNSAELKFLLRKRNKPGRRFELARFMCDHLSANRDDMWLPVTDAKTARQKLQRAFAAEFLCPVQALEKFLSGDFSADAIERAAEHFGVAERAVKAQLVNNRLLPGNVLDDYGGGFDFPYITGQSVANAAASA